MASRPGRGFELDPFQLEAMDAMSKGRSVLVAAPTGSGKTIIAEHAIELGLADGQRTFYTSPIKALANQKFRDFSRRYGTGDVGLLTGDNSVNSDAPVVVMTTEVLRNMLYSEGRAASELGWVVLDEVHFLQDRFRGTVWEEVILHLPGHVRLASLSATVSNLDEIGDWLTLVRGPTEVVLSTTRPVELMQYMAVSTARSSEIETLPLFLDGRPNPDGAGFDSPKGRRYGGDRRRRYRSPRRSAFARDLVERDLAPAIYFIFSRAGCDEAVVQCLDAGMSFTDSDERSRIRSIVENHIALISPADREALDIAGWTRRAESGIAAHHAGMIPALKEAVEVAFSEGLIRIVFATETLALGVNMPARSVVLERLVKFNGETHEMLTPLEFTQLTGRAGRRGMDLIGHAFCSWSPFVEFDDLAGLAASTKFPLRSAFGPSYNMAANLMARLDRERAHEVIGRSLAQFQTDRAAVGTEQQLVELRADREQAEADVECDLGDVREYRAWLVREDEPAKMSVNDADLAFLKPGDVIAASRIGYAVVASSTSRKGTARIEVVHPNGSKSRLSPKDFDEPPGVVASVEVTYPLDYAAIAAALVGLDLALDEDDPRGHPASRCPDIERHLDALKRLEGIERRRKRMVRRREKNQDRLAKDFDNYIEVLDQLDFADGWRLTDKGDMLTGIYNESDVLLVEAIDSGLLDGLDAKELAALASGLTYQHRGSDDPPPPRFATRPMSKAAERLNGLAGRIAVVEKAALGQRVTPDPDFGFASAAFRWADGSALDPILDDGRTGGDFVRDMKQLLDLLRQLVVALAESPVADLAADAIELLDRGVVRAGRDLAPPSVSDLQD